MKNVFVVTLGTSDVQIDLNKLAKDPNFIFDESSGVIKNKNSNLIIHVKDNRGRGKELLASPRNDGYTVQNNLDLFLPILKFPLIEPAIDMFFAQSQNLSASHIMFVYTNQEKENVADQFRNNDTIYFKNIIEKHLANRYGLETETFKFEFEITNHVSNIDLLYQDFNEKCKSFLGISDESIDQIIVLAQGGIDQINQAITLQLIQRFTTKVIQYQKAENQEPIKLIFPQLFIQDLNRQKILKHLNDYDFGLIANSGIVRDEIKSLAYFADRKLNLDYKNLDKESKFFVEDTSNERACDLYIYAKIFLEKGDCGNYLWRLFTLLENLFRIRTDKILGNTEDFFIRLGQGEVNKKWIDKLNEFDGLIDFLKTKRMNNGNPISYDNPNRFTYKHIYNFFVDPLRIANYPEFKSESKNQASLNFIFNKCSGLSQKRNDIAHYLRPINKEMIQEFLPKEITIKDINKNFDSLFELSSEKPFGIYDDIRKEIETLL